MMRKKKGFAQRSSLGYILMGTLVVVIILFCIIAMTATIAPVVLSVHVGDQPAMMTMPILFYCFGIDLVLLEVLFLLFQPGAKQYIEDDKSEPTDKKKVSGQTVIGIVCAVLLLCSLITAPCVCNVFTDDGVSTYVFFKTRTVTWDEVAYYEVDFTEDRGLTLLLHLSKEESISLFGGDVFLNDAFIEKYENEYGFAAHLRELAEQDDRFVIGRNVTSEILEKYYKNSVYWDQILELTK